MQLTDEQYARLGDIGRSPEIPASVRSLAWLIIRYSEGIPTQDVAQMLGITPSAARYWVTVFHRSGMALFGRYEAKGMATADGPAPAGPMTPIPLTAADIHDKTGFSEAQARTVQSNVLRLFDELQYRHRLGNTEREILEIAAQYYDLGREGVLVDAKGYFFSVLDTPLQRIPPLQQRHIGMILKYSGSDVLQPKLRDSGIPRPQHEGCLLALALFRMALALNASGTSTTEMIRFEHATPAFYAVLSGPSAVFDAAAMEEAASLWRRSTGQSGRAFVPDSIHVLDGVLEPNPVMAKVKSVGISPDDLMENAARKIMRFSFIRILDLVDAVYLGQDPEALHKLRTSTRRLRSAFRVFGDALQRPRVRKYSKCLRRLGRATSLIRDIDVLLIDMAERKERIAAATPGTFDGITDYLRRRRLDELAKLREILRSYRFSTFVHSYYRFVNDAVAEPETVIGAPPRVREVAPAQIYQRVGAIRALGRNLEQADVAQLHELRIRFKRLRYTLEFYSEILGDASGELIKDLKKLQDHLGALQDAQRACELLDEYLVSPAMSASRTRGGPADGVRVDLIRYRSDRADEIPVLVDTFRDVWLEFEGSQFRHQLALAVAVL